MQDQVNSEIRVKIVIKLQMGYIPLKKLEAKQKKENMNFEQGKKCKRNNKEQDKKTWKIICNCDKRNYTTKITNYKYYSCDRGNHTTKEMVAIGVEGLCKR